MSKIHVGAGPKVRPLSETDSIGDGAVLRTLSEEATVQGQNVSFTHSDMFYFKINASE